MFGFVAFEKGHGSGTNSQESGQYLEIIESGQRRGVDLMETILVPIIRVGSAGWVLTHCRYRKKVRNVRHHRDITPNDK
jgi:hypothetical protein